MSSTQSKTINTVVNNSKKIQNTAKNAASKGMDKAKDAVKDLMKKQGPVMIFIIVIILVFLIVIIYIIFMMKNSNLKRKALITKPIKLNDLSSPFEVISNDIPKPAMGREFAYSFWTYLESYEQTTKGKLLFYRGGSSTDISNANILVTMDDIQNKMYFIIKTQENNLNGLSKPVDLQAIIDNNYFENPLSPGGSANKYIILKVDYVPLQRWVNFVVIVDNKIITIFMDGEIYSVKSTDELKSLRKPEVDSETGKIKDYTLIVDKPDGSIFIGKNIVNNNMTINGYFSKLEMHNYAISLEQVKSIYNSGPLASGLLASMGIQYGVRSPVYKLNKDVK
jgi:hypothetical protein